MAEQGIEGTRVADGVVRPEWIDVNGHMNVAYYVLAFDLGVDSLWEEFGISADYIEQSNGSTFAVESHVIYRQELLEGDPYIVTSQILAYDAKRIHQFQRLYHAEKQFLAATAEWMNLHVDLDVRRVTQWPDSILSRIEEHAATQAGQQWPADAGRKMRIMSPLYTLDEER